VRGLGGLARTNRLNPDISFILVYIATMADSTESLISRLDTSSDKTAEKVIQKLVKIGRPAVSVLFKAANDLAKPRVRKWSLQALGAIGDKRAGPYLLIALKDERMTVKLHAVHGLARMNYKPAETAIIRLLNDPSGGIRVNSVDALIHLKSKKADKALIRLLNDEQWYVRQHACRACGILEISAALPSLKNLAKHETRKAVLKEIEVAISKLSPRD